MLGETFLKGDGSEVNISALEGKYVGVLLSATWHWQCRRFQQMLEYMYEKLTGEGKAFEIIDMVFPLLHSHESHCRRWQRRGVGRGIGVHAAVDWF